MEDVEDFEINESEHNKLLNAVSKLDKTQHIRGPTRSEPTNLSSEFNLNKSANKLDVKNVVKILEDTAHHVQIGKTVRKTQDTSKVLPKPLEKPQAERIKRATGYEQTKKKLSRWDAIVARSRTVDYVSFPLKSKSTKLQQTKEFLSKFKIKSPLELELDEIDPPAIEEEDEEEDKVYPMSYQEMLEHRQHLAKIRAQQSFKAAKAKRQSKIKSKKYHRLLKKEKLKQQLKEFEELQKTNPEEALRRLEILEKTRALERHTLRHKNTGKWAKNKAVRAKYDKEVRQQLAEQLAVSRSLTQKTQQESSDDETDEALPDFTLSQDAFNPWMVQRSDKSTVDAEFDFGYKKYVQNKMFKKKESDSETEDDEQNEVVSEGKGIRSTKDSGVIVGKVGNNKGIKRKNEKSTVEYDETEDQHNRNILTTTTSNNKQTNKFKKLKIKNSNSSVVISTTNWAVDSVDKNGQDIKAKLDTIDILDAFDTLEDNINSKVRKTLHSLHGSLEKTKKNKHLEKKKSDFENNDNLNELGFKKSKLKPIIDEQLNESSSRIVSTSKESNLNANVIDAPQPSHGSNVPSNSDIDPNRFIQVKPTYLNTSLSQAEHDLDDLDEDEQVVPKVNIEEVFEDDDVVASFRQEKEEEASKDNLPDIALTMPGWGSWGGKGIKARKRKSNRFITKAPPKTPRRDENKGDIIIIEHKDPKLSAHKVTDVPFPFESVKEYEATIRAPLGNTFIPEKAHQKLIKPNVITKIGTIIDPMDEDELLDRKNITYKNESVIKLLAKK